MSEIKELSTPELNAAAKLEAEAFMLPEDWRVGRGRRVGFAIDAAHSPDLDDAIDLTILPGGEGYMLHVSIADVGSFLYDKPAIRAAAQRRGWTKYRGDSVEHPLIHGTISQNALSLIGGEERPVLTVTIPISAKGVIGDIEDPTRDILVARSMTYEDVESTLRTRSGQHAEKLGGLEQVARLLFVARHRGASKDDAVLEDEEGHMLATITAQRGVSHLIVQESMIACGRAMAKYAHDRNIPFLYRAHTPDSTVPYELLLEQTFARYNSHPEPHNGLNVPLYAHVTSPLRRYVDFANHCNIVAYLEGREPVMSVRNLEYTGGRLNRLEAERRPIINAGERQMRRAASRRKVGRTAIDFAQRLADGSATEADIAHILFGAVEGTEDELARTRQEAARYVAARVHMARTVIGIALTRGHLSLTPTEQDGRFTLTDTLGRNFVYKPIHNSRRMAVAAATLIGRMAGTDVDPVVLHRRVAEEKIMENGNRYLQSLHKEKRLRHHWNTELNEETGEHTCTVTVIIGSDWYLYVATAKGKKSSEKKAAAQAITELDLINNPPPVPVEVERKLGPSKNPIVELQARLQQAHAKQVVYVAVLLNAPPNPRSRCTGTLVYEGKEYVAVAEATSKDLAKQMVAEELLERVPLPPLVSRKERLKRRQGG